jgi:hypothetical protein
MQYIEHIADVTASPQVITHVPVSSCTFRITEAAVSVAGNSGAKITATRKVTHFSPLASEGVPTIPAVILAQNVQARLGYFNNNGHFNYITDESVGP